MKVIKKITYEDVIYLYKKTRKQCFDKDLWIFDVKITKKHGIFDQSSVKYEIDNIKLLDYSNLLNLYGDLIKFDSNKINENY